jgi:hypothetical protein
MKYGYDDITFIIPVKIESNNRLVNLYYSLLYLSKIHNFKIIIKEVDQEQKIKDIVEQIKNPNIKYIFEKQTTDFFHRTKYLNDMLEMSDTKITCNFDCDILLPQNNIDQSLNLFNNNFDVVYPYGCGTNLLLIDDLLNSLPDLKNLKEEFNFFVSKLNDYKIKGRPWFALFGHAVMVKTDLYKKVFGENELFKSYGPEDFERYFRFVKLKLNVTHLNVSADKLLCTSGDDFHAQIVKSANKLQPFTHPYFHIEHPRTADSNENNKYFKHNEDLFNSLKHLSYDEYVKMYNTFEYVQKRKFYI